MKCAFLGVFMKKRNYQVQSVTVEMPTIINKGLNDASDKYKMSKSDIVRSVVYDFLISSGILPDIENLNRPEDINIECVGRPSILLSME